MHRQFIWIAVVASLAFGGRRAAAVTIGDLIADPEAYDGAVVTVTGEVAKSLPVGAESGFNLREGTATITIVSRGSAPTVGAHLTVTGKVRVFSEGDEPEATQFPPFMFETSRAPAP